VERWVRAARMRVRSLLRRGRVEAELEAEIRDHLEQRVGQYMAKGAKPSEAWLAARREFGGTEQSKEECREMRKVNWIEEFALDVRYGLRMLTKNPGFTAVAILTLALGIGANTAIFSLMDTVMVRLLPVQKPEELVQVAMLTHGFGRSPRKSYTNPIWESLQTHQDVFAGVFAWGSAEFNLSPTGVAENVRGNYVSGGYFPALGVRAAEGRLIGPDDDRRGCAGVAVLGYGFWQRRYGAQPVSGKMISLNGHPFQIIGVSAAGFFGTEVGTAFDVAAPICSEAIIEGTNSSLEQRSAWWFRVMGRRRRGVSDAQIAARLGVVSPQIFAESLPSNWKPSDQKLFLGFTLTALPAGNGISSLRSEYDLPLKALMAIAGFVLLLACANIASLLLARGAARRKEIGVRLALGASRMRLVRQLLTESVLLSAAGALPGILFAMWGSRLIVRAISTGSEKISLDLAMDGRILGFTAAAAVVTGILFGVLPALRATRVSLAGTMKGANSKNAGGDTKFRAGRWTVAAQVALSLVLVATAGLFLRSFTNLVTLDAGFDRNNVLLASAELHNAGLHGAEFAATRDEILQGIRALPGVISASASMVTPVGNRTWDDFIVVDGDRAPQGDDRDVHLNYVTPDYFATLRSGMMAGRDFDERDTATAQQVAIVNQALVRKFFGGQDAIGKTFWRFETSTKLGAPFVIVGVTRDTKYETLREPAPPTAYFPLAQLKTMPERASIEIRTAGRPAEMEPAVEQAILGVNKMAAIQFITLAQQVDDSLTQERLLATLSGFFGVLALLLAMIGFYGVLAYLLLQRQKEIGIRMALGARRGAILQLVMRDVAVLLATGAAAGLAITWGVTRYVQSLLFELRARDVTTFAMSVCALVVVALGASYLPTRRAMRVDPMVALRHE